jgi:hypothetical protein
MESRAVVVESLLPELLPLPLQAMLPAAVVSISIAKASRLTAFIVASSQT